MNALFQDQRDEIVNAWTDAVFNTYALETTGFLRTQNDPFANPVAHTTREAAGVVYDAVAGEDVDPAQVKKAIDRFVKLRAVQDGTPGQNLGVFLLLKPILRKMVLPRCSGSDALTSYYLEAESRLDSVMLLAFDMYTADRETIAESRIKEIRNQHAQLVRWAQKVGGSPLNPAGKE